MISAENSSGKRAGWRIREERSLLWVSQALLCRAGADPQPSVCTRGLCLAVWHWGHFVPIRIAFSCSKKNTIRFCFSLNSLSLPAGGEAMKHINPWVGVLDKEFEKQIIPLQLKLLELQLTYNETPLQCVQIQLNTLKTGLLTWLLSGFPVSKASSFQKTCREIKGKWPKTGQGQPHRLFSCYILLKMGNFRLYQKA